ncbi:MAG: hypothetical protein HOO96_07545 [Polyangiaceae bacterium]|nr:hypothetical protein [Polyangiaceae bacterium]
MRPHVLLLGLTVLATVAACGGEPSPKSADSAPKSAPTTTAAIRSKPGTVRRSALQETIAGGLGGFLQHVEFSDEPVMRQGQFVGFRVARLYPEDYWTGVDLRAGDVVSKVNGMPIERPEQALVAFRSLAGAKEILVDVERDGQKRQLRVPIEE